MTLRQIEDSELVADLFPKLTVDSTLNFRPVPSSLSGPPNSPVFTAEWLPISPSLS